MSKKGCKVAQSPKSLKIQDYSSMNLLNVQVKKEVFITNLKVCCETLGLFKAKLQKWRSMCNEAKRNQLLTYATERQETLPSQIRHCDSLLFLSSFRNTGFNLQKNVNPVFLLKGKFCCMGCQWRHAWPGTACSWRWRRMLYSLMARAVEVTHQESAKEDLHTLSQEESQRSCLPRTDRSDLCISSLRDIILITLPDFAFPILKVTQSPEFNSLIKRCKQ